MGAYRNGKFIKCDHHKINITATFGSELVLEGSISIPNVILKVYSRIGISDFQMMLLTQLIRLRVEEGELCPSPELLSEYMEADSYRIKKELVELLDKEIIAKSDYYDRERNEIIKGYDFEPLFLKVSDIWAGIRFREIEESQKRIAGDKEFNSRRPFSDDLGRLIATFENEFGRPLSPIEVEQIEQWAADGDPLLVVEALKRAVLRGKHNFKYINSILLEWQKNNLRNLDSIAEYDRDFQKRRTGRGARETDQGASRPQAGEKNGSKKKAFIKSLYV